MKYILIVLILGNYVDSNTHQEFNSQKECEDARKDIQTFLDKKHKTNVLVLCKAKGQGL